jgi:hypothetical protein
MVKSRKRTVSQPAAKPVALTLKIDEQTYLRLATLRAKQRRTHQDILLAALEEYLKRAGV